MSKIKSLFARQIDRQIEEVIKVDQHDENTVITELQEYIVTKSIKDHFHQVYDEIIAGKNNPREGIAVWVSGFFGSGKSSFAKILGYTVSGRTVAGKSSSDIFKDNLKDSKINSMLDVINRTIPTRAVIFDVSMDRGTITGNERITEIMYKFLLRELGYAENFDLAELEMTLEKDGLLEKFNDKFKEVHQGKEWRVRKKLGMAINEASAVLPHIYPQTYEGKDSYANAVGIGKADITANKLAERAFELTNIRMPGKALIFIIDEVGQYVSRSVDKMLDLMGVVQAFGREGKNRVKQKKAIAPFWIVVTSQEKLNEVVDSLDSRKIELARLQDRFRIPIDLKQSDISEITGKRVLEKNEQAKTMLETLYDNNEGRLKTFCTLERTSRDTSITKETFVDLYPYLPYQIDLSIDIVSGLRLKRGAHRHIGGSNRTIIKQAQEMMINPRTMVAEEPIGTLVTFDKIYELLYMGNLLPIETYREIDEFAKSHKDDEIAVKVLKAIALLEQVKDLPRTPHNIAVVLHPAVEADPGKAKVEEALKKLEQAQIIRDSEEGFKLLTVQEKAWDTERKSLDPKRAERNKILRDIFKDILANPKIKNYRFKNIRSFKTALSVEGETIDPDGQVKLNVLIAEDQADMTSRCQEARESSTATAGEIFWVCSFNDEIEQLFKEVFRSLSMISKHERLAAHGKLTPDEASCLADEKIRWDKNQRLLRTKLSESLQSGTGFFRGVQYDSSGLGQTLQEVLHRLLDIVIPDIYPKLELGIRHLKGDEAEKFLTAANLNGLPPVFYDGENGLFLVIKQDGKFLPNLSANICTEILEYINREHKYGNKVTGKMLENYFLGPGYGWERDVVQLVLAVQLRGGAIEITHQGRKYKNHNDPACRVPFTNIHAFRNASFAPREPIELRTLADAARHYEEITGKEVDIEEGAIANAFKKLAANDREDLLPLVTRLNVLKLPGADFMENHLQTVEGILNMPADDCVKTLAGEGKSYKEARLRSSSLKDATEGKNLETFTRSKNVMDSFWPVLKDRDADETLSDQAEQLEGLLQSETFFESLGAIKIAADSISAKYRECYEKIHRERSEIFQKRLDEV
ncbi:MAG: BREX system P-loop protein BrxC, partial [Candidatus Aminicenantes bacterium]